jgi:hypothetical protein
VPFRHLELSKLQCSKVAGFYSPGTPLGSGKIGPKCPGAG